MDEIENSVAEIDVSVADNNPKITPSIDNSFSYNAGVAHLRLVLMLLVSANIFGVAGGTVGRFIQIAAQFATMAYFIISGFMVLTDDSGRDDRIKRTIGRAAITFLVLVVAYFGINALFYYIGGYSIFDITPWKSRRFWFNFLFLNVWQYNIGGIIWYVQAYLYAYIFIFLVNKLKLLKLDWLFFIVFEAIGLLSSEFSGFIGINFHGYRSLPNCFFTMAIPYIFLGAFIRRKIVSLMKIDNLWYTLIGIGGLAVCFGEGALISYLGKLYTTYNFIGLGITAFCLCVIALQPDIVNGDDLFFPDEAANPNGVNYIEAHFPYYFTWIYYLLQPLSVVLALVIANISAVYFVKLQNWMWLITYVVALGISMLIGLLIDIRLKRKINKPSAAKHSS